MAGNILRTYDGGANWTIHSSGDTLLMYSIRFADAQHGICVGDSGWVLHTDDGGENWNPYPLNTWSRLRCVRLNSALEAWMCATTGEIWRYTDSGLEAPTELTITAHDGDLHLNWRSSGAPFYRVMTAQNAEDDFLTIAVQTADTFALITPDNSQAFYHVVSSATP
ncbi:MAG: hypothetical protein IPH10_05405 [bacterium]|nr:hypothetical protein [bacterium]